MRFGIGYEPMNMLLSGCKIAGPQKHRNGPVQSDRHNHGMIRPSGLSDCPTRAVQGLSRMPLQPQRSCECNTGGTMPGPALVEAKQNRAAALEDRIVLRRCLKLDSGTAQIS